MPRGDCAGPSGALFPAWGCPYWFLPSPGLAILWVSGSQVGSYPLANPPQWCREGLDPRAWAAGGWGLIPSAISITGFQLVLTQQTCYDSHLPRQSGQTQEGWNKGPDSRDQPPKQGPQCLCQEAGSIEQPGQCGPQRWELGLAPDKLSREGRAGMRS